MGVLSESPFTLPISKYSKSYAVRFEKITGHSVTLKVYRYTENYPRTYFDYAGNDKNVTFYYYLNWERKGTVIVDFTDGVAIGDFIQE